jgi:hypothetical protein
MCKHEELEYCPCCGQVRCKKCGQVWGNQPVYVNPVYPTYPWWGVIPPYPAYKITCTDIPYTITVGDTKIVYCY